MELLKVIAPENPSKRPDFGKFIKEWNESRIEMRKETELFMKSDKYKELQKRLTEKYEKRGFISKKTNFS